MAQTVPGLALVLLFVCFILGLDVGHRIGLQAPVSVYIWFMNVNLALFLFIFFAQLDKNDFIFTAMPLPPFNSVLLPTILIYSLLIFAGWLSSLGLRKRRLPTSTVLSRRTQRSFAGTWNIPNFVLWAIFLLVFSMEAFHFWEIDKSILWHNQTYLTIKDPIAVGIHTVVGRMIHFLLLPLGLLLVGAGTFSWMRHRKLTAAVFLLLSIYPFIIALAENSRWAPFYILASLVVLALFGDIRRNLLSAIASGAVAFLVFLKVLIGRNTPYQGLDGTLDIFHIIFSNVQVQMWVVGLLVNVFQGAQSVANALLIRPHYPEVYKLLSFSPTISAIDHFDKILDLYAVRITPAVPMNTYSEAYFFGPGYFLFLLIILITWLRTMTKISFRKDMLGTVLAAFSYWIILFISQYPVRNSMRLIYVSLLIGILGNIALSAKSKTQTGQATKAINDWKERPQWNQH